MIDPFRYNSRYHASTPITFPRYAHINRLEATATAQLRIVCGPIVDSHALMLGVGKPAASQDFHLVDYACKTLYDGIIAVCPPGPDRDRAEADVRLAQMLAHDAMLQAHDAKTQDHGSVDCFTPARILEGAIAKLREARLWARASIALANEADLPAWQE